jgi:hypothetical protein
MIDTTKMDEHLTYITGVGDTIPFAEIFSLQRRRSANDDIYPSNLGSDLLSVKAACDDHWKQVGHPGKLYSVSMHCGYAIHLGTG